MHVKYAHTTNLCKVVQTRSARILIDKEVTRCAEASL